MADRCGYQEVKEANAELVRQLQKYEAAAEYLRAEARKIPLGEGNVQRGFSSTYNALIFCAETLERACAEKPNDECAIWCDDPEHQKKHDFSKWPEPRTCELCRLRIVGHQHVAVEKPKCVCGGEGNVVGCIPSCPAYVENQKCERVVVGDADKERCGMALPCSIHGGAEKPAGDRGNCSECGALVERLYSLMCPACYDKLAAGMESRPLPPGWDGSPKGCWAQHPKTREICQLPPDGHTVHERDDASRTQILRWGRRGS